MPYIVFSRLSHVPICRFDGQIADIQLRAGEVAIPCGSDADPNDPCWIDEADSYDVKYALGNARSIKLGEINRACEVALATIKAGYPEGEVQSWDRQYAEACAIQAKQDALAPTLDGIASARGLPRDELAGRVMTKANLFAVASGQIIGQRQRYEDAIAIASIEELSEIIWQATP